MNERDPISQKYFNQESITLDVDKTVDAELFDVFNNLEVIARLTGAPDGSYIHVSRGTSVADTLNLQVKHPIFKYPSEYFIINDGELISFELVVDSIYVREEFQDQGIGVRSVMLSILQAKELGFHSVSLTAAGSAKNRTMFFGYHVWPSMGFDAPLPTKIRQRLPPGLSHSVLLSDLIKTDEGEEWWYDNGDALDLAFELREDSLSWELLSEYAEARGISL